MSSPQSHDEELWGSASPTPEPVSPPPTDIPPPPSTSPEISPPEMTFPWFKRERTTTAGSENPQEKKKSKPTMESSFERLEEGRTIGTSGPSQLSAPVATTPLATTPLATTPLATTPLATTPLATTPLATTPLATSSNLEDLALASEFCKLKVDKRREWNNWSCNCGYVHRAGFCVVTSGSSAGGARARGLPRNVLECIAFWLAEVEEGELMERRLRARNLLGSLNKRSYRAIRTAESFVEVFDAARPLPLDFGLQSCSAIALIGESWTDASVRRPFESVNLQNMGRVPSIVTFVLVLNDDITMQTYLKKQWSNTPKVLLIPNIWDLKFFESVNIVDVDLIKLQVNMDALGIQDSLSCLLECLRGHVVLVLVYRDDDFEEDVERRKLAALISCYPGSKLDVIVVEREGDFEDEAEGEGEFEDEGEGEGDFEDSSASASVDHVRLWLRRRQADGLVVTHERRSPQLQGQINRLLNFNQTTPPYMMA